MDLPPPADRVQSLFATATDPLGLDNAFLAPKRGRMPLLRWTHGLVNRSVMLLDWVLVTALAGLAPCPLLGFAPTITTPQALVIAGLQATLFTVIIRALGGYRIERYENSMNAAGDLLVGLAAACALTGVMLAAFTPAAIRSPGWIVSWEATIALALLIDRQMARWLVHYVDRKALLRRNVVVIGSGERARETVGQLSQAGMADRYNLIGVFDILDDGPVTVGGHPVLGGITTLRRYAQTERIDIVVVALPWSQSADIFRAIEQIQWISADVVVPFDPIGYQHFSASVVWIAGKAGLQLLCRPFKGTQGLLKIAEDYIIATVALVLLSPVLLLTALAIRLDSKGPILFRQARSGFNDNLFMICKFRTMVEHAGEDARVGTRGRDDPRITRVGRFLRRTSIDELPQLLNVLRGEMSIVGPRPYVPRMLVGNALFDEAVREYTSRHRIKPGITGYAQAHGYRGGALRNMEQARRSVAMDLYYISNWSLWFDIKIMARTLLVGMSGRDVF
jgi:putative colanic acid biosynthesis UDP-glucose lipid carrier transferase